MDGITKEQYGQDLQGHLRNLHERLRRQRYRHRPKSQSILAPILAHEVSDGITVVSWALGIFQN